MCCLSFLLSLVASLFTVTSGLRYHGADFSSLLLLESTTNINYTTSDHGKPQPLEHILRRHGANIARIRIWTAGVYDLNYGLELAKRAKAVGMDLLIDLHYDDTWADGDHQAIPEGWPTDLDPLLSRVYDYTYELVKAFEAQETPIQFIQIGNEVNKGLLWPTGEISVNGFMGVSKLLHAGVLAVRKASPETRTVIHLADGWHLDSITSFYAGVFYPDETNDDLGCLLTAGDVDVMAFSMYPFYGTKATLENLMLTMEHIVATYDKDVMVIETDWPAECNTTATPLSEPDIPVNTHGQIEWIEDIHRALHQSAGDKALGILYWEPAWIGNAALGSSCADNLLVTTTGRTRESMKLFLDLR